MDAERGQSEVSRSGGARLGCAGSTDPVSRPRCSRIRSMTAGASMLAMTRSRQPHCRQVSISIANTRLRRCAQLIASCRSVAAASPRSLAVAAPVLGTIWARSGLAGRNRDTHRSPKKRYTTASSGDLPSVKIQGNPTSRIARTMGARSQPLPSRPVPLPIPNRLKEGEQRFWIVRVEHATDRLIGDPRILDRHLSLHGPDFLGLLHVRNHPSQDNDGRP